MSVKRNVTVPVGRLLTRTGPTITPGGDIVNPDPSKLRLAAHLGNNGGPTKTLELKHGSKAIDHGGRSTPPRDQRGVKRDERPDIGAFEAG